MAASMSVANASVDALLKGDLRGGNACSSRVSHAGNRAQGKNVAAFASPSLKNRFLGSAEVFGAACESKSRVSCAVSYAPPSTARLDLIADAEERWTRVESSPAEETVFTGSEFEEALDKYDFNFEVGEKVRGIILKADNAGAFVDIGAKAPALLPPHEASIYRVKNMSDLGLVPGLEDEFVIVDDDDARGRMVVSLRRIQLELAWERARQLLADDVTVKGRVLSVNRGGLMVEVEGLRAFVPLSQVGLRTPKEDLPGKEIALKFLEIDEERTRLVLSNRRAMAATQAQTFTVGDVVVGKVSSIKPYGAFVEIGGINGLLHISQISHDRVTNVDAVLSEGDELKVMILSYDRDSGRVSLSTKKLEPTPGDMLRNPQLVYEKADEMAQTFRERVAAAEAAARAEEARLQQEGFGLGTPGLDPALSGFAAF